MFDVDMPEKSTRIMESDYVIPGERIVPPVETPVGKVGLAIVSFNCGLILCVFQVLLMYGTDLSTLEVEFTFLLLTMLSV
jgi:hypothetical protein